MASIFSFNLHKIYRIIINNNKQKLKILIFFSIDIFQSINMFDSLIFLTFFLLNLIDGSFLCNIFKNLEHVIFQVLRNF